MLARIFCLVDASDDLSLLPDLAAVGVDGFQVRAPELSDRELLGLTELVVGSVRVHGATVVVNDRVDVALAGSADGVHLGAEDLPVRAARRLAPGLVVGATCRNAADVARASEDGADYAGFGPVFETGSKTGLPEPLGISALRAAAGSLPLVAIGGIGAANAADVVATGAYGVAVIGGIWRQPDPVAAAKDLVSAID